MISFPQGDYKFSAREVLEIGSYLSCSLASPVNDWNTHLEAKRTAEDVLRLMKSIPVAQIEEESESQVEGCQAATSSCNMSRRAFMGASV